MLLRSEREPEHQSKSENWTRVGTNANSTYILTGITCSVAPSSSEDPAESRHCVTKSSRLIFKNRIDTEVKKEEERKGREMGRKRKEK